jgi:MFS transporter, PAT family, beta-lactamase induction signal transducer AmpG
MLWSLCNRRMLICVLIGFSSGLPLFVGTTLVQAWLHEKGVGLHEIGLLNLTGLPYTWKFAWAPLLDRYSLPFLGRRRGWALCMQIALFFCIAAFGLLQPERSMPSVVALACAVAFFSATQDVVLDAYRRELLPDRELGFGTSLHINAYRLAGLVPGSLALILADHLPWSWVYLIVAMFMAVGILTSLFAGEAAAVIHPPTTLTEAVVGPFREFFARGDRSHALLIVLFMLLYKLGDAMASALLIPFYLEVGFTKTVIGTVAKGAALPAFVIGSLVGGLTIAKAGINRSLWIFGVLQVVSTLGFVVLARSGPDVWLLGCVVSFEYLSAGLGASAFLAFMSRATNRRFTATQYALFSSLVALPRTLASASTGYLAEGLGYPGFFLTCALVALPGLWLLTRVAPWSRAGLPAQQPVHAPEQPSS